METIKKNCFNCALRHYMCGYEFIEPCPHFVIGKCFICQHDSNDSEEIKYCTAEDRSGYGCDNFLAK